ncbi:hypothetical protein Bbelb_160490 [Branchiostoma belcheri]|nr:hypothetical protein Bbelb_160490 [Branchiostoma belcheri]
MPLVRTGRTGTHSYALGALVRTGRARTHWAHSYALGALIPGRHGEYVRIVSANNPARLDARRAIFVMSYMEHLTSRCSYHSYHGYHFYHGYHMYHAPHKSAASPMARLDVVTTFTTEASIVLNEYEYATIAAPDRNAALLLAVFLGTSAVDFVMAYMNAPPYLKQGCRLGILAFSDENENSATCDLLTDF